MDFARPPDYDAINRYAWSWSPEENVDANYMDLAYLVARNSSCKDGHMGCVLVSGIAHGSGTSQPAEPLGNVVLCTINSSLFGLHRSDCHAEANAVAESARRGQSLRGLSCYVTRAPCVNCYKLLATAGICRIVSPQDLVSPDCKASADTLGIESVIIKDSEARDARRRHLGNSNEDMDRVRALREERKRLRKEGSYGKKTVRKVADAEGSTVSAPAEVGSTSNSVEGTALDSSSPAS